MDARQLDETRRMTIKRLKLDLAEKYTHNAWIELFRMLDKAAEAGQPELQLPQIELPASFVAKLRGEGFLVREPDNFLDGTVIKWSAETVYS